jgi:hypothetical protein
MANIVETAQWEAGVYQFETSDPVEGGPDGIDNLPSRQLANRTAYLKAQQEAHAAAADPHPQYATLVQMTASINALVAAAPGALDTLKELADALGDDPNFATTMTNALALKAPLASPILTGAPKAPTPAQFDASTSIATMEALQRALGSVAGCTLLVGSSNVLTASAVGKHHDIGTTGMQITLPPVAGLPVGASLYFAGGVYYTLKTSDGKSIFTSDSLQSGSTSVNMYGTRKLIWRGDVWETDGIEGVTTLSANGYKRFSSGLILNWGSYNTTGTSASTGIGFPLAFPNACVALNTTPITPLSLGCIDAVTSKDKNGFNVIGSQVQGSSANYSAHSGSFTAVGY